MKNVFKIFSITLLTLLVSGCVGAKNFHSTQADMLNSSASRLAEIDATYEKVCNNLAENFKADKSFVAALKQDKEIFLKYRLIQRDVILPSYPSDATAYGTNYKLYSDSYLVNLTENKIESLKNTVKLYCLYNEDLHKEGACSEKIIEKIFK